MSESVPQNALNSASQPLPVFAFIWAMATQIHLMSFHFWATTWQGWMLVLCVSLVLLQPASLPRFALMITASLNNLFQHLPFVPNHILFEGMVNLTILIGILGSCWKHRRKLTAVVDSTWSFRSGAISVGLLTLYLVLLIQFSSLPDVCGFLTLLMILYFGRNTEPSNWSKEVSSSVVQRVSGVIRLEVTVMYFWAVIQKLNRDYFDSSVSCAAKLQRELEESLYLPDTPESWQIIYPVGSVLAEAFIPVLLLIPRTRRAGLILALVFHFWLAIHPHPGIYSYSALVYGVLFFFLSGETLTTLQKKWQSWSEYIRSKARVPAPSLFPRGLLIPIFYVTGISSSVLYSWLGRSGDTFSLVNKIGFVYFMIWATWLSGFYVVSEWKRNQKTETLPRIRFGWPMLGLLLVIVNGCSPWVGLKTQTSFAMFSNLRTEFAPNHYFLIRVDMFSYQEDMVEIRGSEPDLLSPTKVPRSIEQFANPGRIMPMFELRRLLNRVDGDVHVTIFREGKTEAIQRKGNSVSHPEIFASPSLLERKVLWFRRHQDWQGPMPCTH